MLKKMRLTAKNVRVLLLPVILFFVYTVLPVIALAQANFEGGSGSEDVPLDGGEVGDTPINGGIVLLLIAGVLFGVYMLYKSQRKAQLAMSK